MSGWKKLASAAAATGGGLNVEDVFGTYLWEGDASNPRTITNGIDLSGEGGLTIIKRRDGGTQNWGWWDTERGPDSFINSNSFNAENTTADVDLTDFNSDGFTLGSNYNLDVNSSGGDFCSWSLRKAPKFFDVVTYTGNGTAGRTVSHNLGSVPGAILIKCTSNGATNWSMFHREMHATAPQSYRAILNSTSTPDQSSGFWNNTLPTSTEFTLGNNNEFNGSGRDFVAYLFAHNNSDGEFGPNADQDIIKCGSYTGNGSTTGPDIDLGFEPQWLLIRKVSGSSEDWFLQDIMRGMPVTPAGGSNLETRSVKPNANDAEADNGLDFHIKANGFQVTSSSSKVNGNNERYIYIAIRRGLMAVPTAATDVFDMDFLGATSPNPPAYNSSGWPVDMGIQGAVGAVNSNATSARLIQGKFLVTDDTNAETTSSQYAFDFQDGWRDSTAVSNDYLGFMWRRAPNFFDVVCYNGNSAAGHAVSHNLGVAPEMMWIKRRNTAIAWCVYHHGIDFNGDGLPETDVAFLNSNASAQDNNTMWNDTAPTATNFTLGNYTGVNNGSGKYIAYLFATLAGISKVGSYTGTGSTQTIDCGFSAGARFVMIKRTDSAGNWYVFNTKQGITTGSDGYFTLDTTAGSLSVSAVQPHNSGFIVNSTSTSFNGSGGNYIFYAIA